MLNEISTQSKEWLLSTFLTIATFYVAYRGYRLTKRLGARDALRTKPKPSCHVQSYSHEAVRIQLFNDGGAIPKVYVVFLQQGNVFDFVTSLPAHNSSNASTSSKAYTMTQLTNFDVDRSKPHAEPELVGLIASDIDSQWWDCTKKEPSRIKDIDVWLKKLPVDSTITKERLEIIYDK